MVPDVNGNSRSDDLKVIIRVDKIPSNEHERRFNAPMATEVAAIIVRTEIIQRDIVISKRDQTKQRVAETDRSYDALQYPILYREDGYRIKFQYRCCNIKKSQLYGLLCMPCHDSR
ncbi:ATP-dependent DNA helicase [Trichonephila inaurata madagascariensis]|uniref:ATP-dependent DNA helicase n=1 Tax=Trichonephila inaurata madagascariensis TaxID=2747483 RepID=A0A8X7CTZ6_9ARAC|nr:ATP-dependent DNA helicase [Trichonephila inaurata madagascariensis]